MNDKDMHMDLQSLYYQMVTDSTIINEYAIVTEKEKLPGRYATHDLTHVNRVIGYCEKISKLLGLNTDDVIGIKIAALLHDIGCSKEGKGGHDKRSYEWSRNYLSNKNLTDEMFNKILTAIEEHSEGAKSMYGKILLFADKIDICKERILQQGLLIEGNRQYAHIKSTDFEIKDNNLNLTFNTDGQLDVTEMNKYYFTRKVFESIQNLSNHFSLGYNVFLDNEKMKDLNDGEYWKDFYEKEIQQHYDGWEKYLREKIKLKRNYIQLICKNARFDKPMLEAGSGTGKVSAYFASLDYDAYAMDIEEDMLNIAEGLSKKISPQKPVKIIHADIRNIPFDDNTFAITHSSGVLEHFQDDEIIKILNEQLRVSDKVVFAVPSAYFTEEQKMNGDERFLSKTKWREIISKTEGKIVTETFTHYRTLQKRLIELPKNLHRIKNWKANFVFELESNNKQHKEE